jgi:hypothetical protein
MGPGIIEDEVRCPCEMVFERTFQGWTLGRDTDFHGFPQYYYSYARKELWIVINKKYMGGFACVFPGRRFSTGTPAFIHHKNPGKILF